MSKIMTRDCMKCADLELTIDHGPTCTWGNAKKVKVLEDRGKTFKECKLLDDMSPQMKHFEKICVDVAREKINERRG